MKKLIFSLALLLGFIAGSGQELLDSTNYFYTDDSTRLFVKKSGKGPICIFIHGGPGAWSKSFEALGGAKLETALTMIYYDQRGCGRSESPKDGNYDLNRMLLDIDQIRKHFGAEKVYLLAHSFGGILATNYADKYAAHVNGLILANTTLDMKTSLNNQTKYINQLLGTNFLVKDSSFNSVKTTFLSARKALSDSGLSYKMLSESKALVKQVDAVDKDNPSDYGFARHVFDMPVYWEDYRGLSKSVNLPVLVITGEKDHSIGELHYKSFKFPHMQVIQLPAGHIDYFENNKAFIKAVTSFVIDK